MVRLHFPFRGVPINERIPVASSDKALFRCPTCSRTFRVPVSYAERAECPECAKLSAANTAAEHVERDAFRQERVEQRHEKDQAPQNQRAKHSLLHRLRDGWVSMRQAAQEQKAERERMHRLQRGQARVRFEEQSAQNPALSTPRRAYQFLQLFGQLMFAFSIFGCIGGGFMIFAGLDPKGPATLIGGFMLFVSSVGGLTTAQLIAMAVNVAGDIEDAKNHVATIDQYFRYRNARGNDD